MLLPCRMRKPPTKRHIATLPGTNSYSPLKIGLKTPHRKGSSEPKTIDFQGRTVLLHPGRLTWNIIMEVWKIIFLSKWVICRFHVNLPGCSFRGGGNFWSEVRWVNLKQQIPGALILHRYLENLKKNGAILKKRCFIGTYINITRKIWNYHLAGQIIATSHDLGPQKVANRKGNLLISVGEIL